MDPHGMEFSPFHMIDQNLDVASKAWKKLLQQHTVVPAWCNKLKNLKYDPYGHKSKSHTSNDFQFFFKNWPEIKLRNAGESIFRISNGITLFIKK